MKKELFSLLLSAVLLVSATACNRSDMESMENISETNPINDTSTESISESDCENAETNPENSFITEMINVRTGRSSYSPIRLDRYADGQVVLHLDSKEEYPFELCDFFDNTKINSGYLTGTKSKNRILFVELVPNDSANSGNLIISNINRSTKDQKKTSIQISSQIFHDFSFRLLCSLSDDGNGFLCVFSKTYNNGDCCLRYLLRTQDHGENWNLIAEYEDHVLGCEHTVKDVYFFDDQKGLAISSYKNISVYDSVHLTMDGGKTWTKANLPFEDFDPNFENEYHGVFLSYSFWGNHYRLTYSVYGKDFIDGYRYIALTFSSEDFMNWTLMK